MVGCESGMQCLIIRGDIIMTISKNRFITSTRAGGGVILCLFWYFGQPR